MGTIYRITHKDSGTTYIGSTTMKINRRWDAHRVELRRGNHYNPHLQYDWNKYGSNAFEWAIIEGGVEDDDLIPREQFWLDQYKQLGKVYNYGTMAGNNRYGVPMPEEATRKMSKMRKGHIVSRETRRKISEALMGHEVSEETRLKISRKGKLHPYWGKHRSEKTKQKISVANARSYPALIHQETGEIIPAGLNLCQLCRKHNFHHTDIWLVIHGKRKHYKGWRVYE